MDFSASCNLSCSIVGGKEIVAGDGSVGLSGHPVAEEEGGEEANEGGVDWADTVSPGVESPADDPEVWKKSLNLL